MTRITAICGATASGKSDLVLKLAQKHGGIIINADSQQVYKGLPITTAVPTDTHNIPHLLYEYIEPTQDHNAYLWITEVKQIISNTQEKIWLVGGTGLYIHLLRNGIKIDNQYHTDPTDLEVIYLYKNKEELLNRIRSRIDKMIQSGMIEEVQTFYEQYGKNHHLYKTIGFIEVCKHLDSLYSLHDMIEAIYIRTRQYAKRQNTWFRNHHYDRIIYNY